MKESELIKDLLNDSIEADKRINSIKEEQKEKRKDRMNDIIKGLDTSQDFYSFNNVVYFSTAAGRGVLDVSKIQHINISRAVTKTLAHYNIFYSVAKCLFDFFLNRLECFFFLLCLFFVNAELFITACAVYTFDVEIFIFSK